MKSRLDYNLEILSLLESYFRQNTDLRFWQGLCLLSKEGISLPGNFYDESAETLQEFERECSLIIIEKNNEQE